MTALNRVLVVEPDGDVASDLGNSLSLVSEEVIVVRSASSAIVWLAEHGAPDVAVIDLQLTDLDAATLVALLRRRAVHSLPLFYVSRDPRVAARFDDAPVLAVPFEPIHARAVLSETLLEHEARLGR